MPSMMPPQRLIVFSIFAAFPSLKLLDAFLHFQMWWHNAANAAS